jgi:hypothetical protein
LYLFIIANAILSFIIVKLTDKYYFRIYYRKEEREFEKKLNEADKRQLKEMFEEYGSSRYTDDYVHQAQVAARLCALETDHNRKVEFFQLSSYKLTIAWIDTFRTPSPAIMNKQIRKVVHLRGTEGLPDELADRDTIQIVYRVLIGEINMMDVKNPDAIKLLRKIKK